MDMKTTMHDHAHHEHMDMKTNIKTSMNMTIRRALTMNMKYDHKHEHIVAKAGNSVRSLNDPTAHAEILVIREACKKIGLSRLTSFSLYVTLEPCPMCCQAISFARLPKLVFGAYDAKGGGVEHGPKIFSHTTSHHNLEILGGIEEQRCGKILTDFFNKKRQEGSNLKKNP